MKIYTHNIAADIVDLMEDSLIQNNIRVPSPEDDERDPDDIGLYGSTYSDMLDVIEDILIDLINTYAKGAEVVSYEFE